MNFGSATVGTSAAALPAGFSAVSPGSLVLYNAGPNAITIGPAGVTAGEVGSGFATIAAGSSVPLPLVGGFNPGGKIYAVAATAASVLNWFNGTVVNP